MICIHHAEWESGAAEHGAQEETIPALREEGINWASCLHCDTWDGVLRNNASI